jgi:hypothetical protein
VAEDTAGVDRDLEKTGAAARVLGDSIRGRLGGSIRGRFGHRGGGEREEEFLPFSRQDKEGPAMLGAPYRRRSSGRHARTAGEGKMK